MYLFLEGKIAEGVLQQVQNVSLQVGLSRVRVATGIEEI